jgi:endo-1,4-beta-xylanase
VNRRTFMQQTGAAALGTLVLSPSPVVLTARRTARDTSAGELVFQPVFTQAGAGPHMSETVYASDPAWDAFRSNVAVSKAGVAISDAGGIARFGINVRWNVEGFGYLFLTADNGGDFYELPARGTHRILNLNHELARSRISRNGRRLARHAADGWKPSRDIEAFSNLSREYLEDATRAPDDERKGALAQKALQYALWAGEWIELERARWDIERAGPRPGFRFGCDARAYYQMDADLFLERFREMFNFATVNHYLIGTHQDFEPARGEKRFGLRDVLVNDLRRLDIIVEGRPLVWFHRWVTPDWLKAKSYPELLKYVEQHVRDVMRHYGDRIQVWEVANEMHDWANELRLTPEQMVEVTRLACEVARDTNPKVVRLINNCCPYGEYVHQRKWTDLDATYPQRTPWQFMRDLQASGAPFDVSGIQMYFPSRDLSDSILLIERFAEFGRPVHVTEVGASSGPSERSVKLDALKLPTGPYAWHRPWDEELQADWTEGLYTLAYSKPYIEAASWYDFVDPHGFIANGGLLRSTSGDPKPAWERLKSLQARWSRG